MPKESKKTERLINMGIMPKGKCIIASNDDETFKAQLDTLCENDRKIVADFRRMLRKKGEKKSKRVP